MRVALVGAELEENLALRCLAGALQAEGHDLAAPDPAISAAPPSRWP
jgi:hypothetical protein